MTQSPHRRLLVLAGNYRAFEQWLFENKVSRHHCHYIKDARELRGYSWENAYLIRARGWELSPLIDSGILDRNFPGWLSDANNIETLEQLNRLHGPLNYGTSQKTD